VSSKREIVSKKEDAEDDLRPEYDFSALVVIKRGPGRKASSPSKPIRAT
jgi:hypothetical protein